MPAHRSDAETEIRTAVVAHLRRHRPDARIIHEINAGANRIDVMAVSLDEIISVEIKSERDKLDRLPAQMAAMKGCSHFAVAALHRKFMQGEPAHPDHLPRPEGIMGDVWWHPKAQDMAEANCAAYLWGDLPRSRSFQMALPVGSLGLLHRAELQSLCGELSVKASSRAPRGVMMDALRWSASGRDLTLGICRQLRARTLCAEADDPITEDMLR